ncbi:NACHT domain-containing protein [Saccharopolyspora rosea]|uniref:NACHT domain-containing protein n=1 Tax=Saccharopolyspora rosea TaxID=524884 RepID=UPI0021DAD7A3|nr:NACHT domain-containing protein [Saccharopolyspora rosea]
MSGLESAALRAGSTVLKHLATSWLARRKSEVRRGADLTELIALRFGGLRERDRRALRRRLDEAAELAAEHLERLCEREFADLPDNERAATIDAVADALDEADLSDATLLRADLDPLELARDVRRQVPTAPHRAGLGEAGRALFDRALDQSCVHLVHLVRELPEYDSRLAEESLRRATEVLRGVDRVLDRIPDSTLDAPAGTDHDEAFRRRYQQLVARHHEDLELIGVSVRNFRPRTKLSVAYLSLTARGRDRRAEPVPRDVAEPETMRAEAALARSDRTLVRGEAGSGKSTLLRWIAVQAARENFTGELADLNGTIPILVKLRSYADDPLPNPEGFLADPQGPTLGPVPEGWTHRQLLAGRVLLLVDGVDELAEAKRRQVRDWLDKLLRNYPDTRIVVTSRPAAASTKWLAAEGFRTVDLEPMTASDVRDFLDRWHRALLAADSRTLPFDRAEVENRHRDLLVQLDARPHLRGLARNPLLCAMLCALNLDRGGDLPRDRNSLYDAALEMLLVRREAEREIRHQVVLDYRHKLTLLQDLAYWLVLNGRSEMDRTMALRRFDRKFASMRGTTATPEGSLDHLVERSGVIREPAENRIDFVHRTFLEYLAAREIAAEEHVPMLIAHADSDQWRETVVMAAGLLSRVRRAELLGGLLDRAAKADPELRRRLHLLAATCVESVEDLPAEVLARVETAIRALVPPNSPVEAELLATVGEPLLDYLPDDVASLPSTQAVACVRTAAFINGPAAMSRLAHYASDERSPTQDEIASVWRYFDPEAFAARVLAEAPLDNGHISVESLQHLSHLRELTNLRSISINLTEEITDFEFVPRDVEVRSIRVRNAVPVSLAPLEGRTALASLQVRGPGSLLSLDTLGTLPLERLLLRQREPLQDLEFLRQLPDLRSLSLDALDEIADFSPIATSGALVNLELGAARRIDFLKDLGTLVGLKSLRITRCSPVDLADLPTLSPTVHTLAIDDCWVTGLEHLARLPNLRYLQLFGCPSVTSIEALRELTQLEIVSLSRMPPGLDVSPLADLDAKVRVRRSDRLTGLDKLHPVRL